MKTPRIIFTAAIIAVITGSLSFMVRADDFAQHSKRVNFNLGTGSAFGDNYTVAGVGIAYYPIHGLELGFDGKLWFGGDSDIYEISPSATYIFTQLGNLKPYAGVLYRKTFIEEFDDLAAFGGRAGLIFDSGNRVYTRVGMVYVEYQDCNDTIFRSCSETYPEVAIGLAF